MSAQVDQVRLAGRRPRLTPDEGIDPITAEVIRNVLETVCFEMAAYVSRTATTPILNQSNERNATVLDARGRLAALSVGIPQFMLTSTLPVRFALEFLGVEEFRRGRRVRGQRPVPRWRPPPRLQRLRAGLHVRFERHERRRRRLARAHRVDPVPPRRHRRRRARRLQRHRQRHLGRRRALAGASRSSTVASSGATCSTRCRPTTGSPTTSATSGPRSAPPSSPSERLGDLLDRARRAATVEAAVDSMIDYAGRRFREEVRAWPDGRYEADCWVDHDPLGNPDVHLHVAVTVDGERLAIDFTGSDSRPELQAWSTFGNTRGYTIAQIASMMDPEIPKNEGFFDAIDLIVPQGCVLNPPAGQAGVGRHPPPRRRRRRGHRPRARSTCCPTRPCRRSTRPASRRSSSASTRAPARPFTDHSAEVYAGWCNAASGMDAWGAQNAAFGNLWKATAEINEALYPHVQWGRDYRIDSGGPGQWRGLCGSHYVKEVRVDVEGLHVRRRHAVPDAGHLRRPTGRAQPAHDPLRIRRSVRRGPHRRLGADRSRPAALLRLRRRWRLGRSARPRSGRRCSTTCSTSTSRSRAPGATTAWCSPARSTTSRSRSTRRPPRLCGLSSGRSSELRFGQTRSLIRRLRPVDT